MASLQNLDDLLNRSYGNASGAPDNIFFFKINSVSGSVAAASGSVAGQPLSCWRYDGFPCGNASAITTTGETPTSATVGALRFSQVSAGFEKYIIQLGLTQNYNTATIAGTVILYDRLYHVGGISTTSTAVQTLTSVPLTRNTSGKGNFAFFEVGPSSTGNNPWIGTTLVDASCEYVNSLGQTCSSVTTIGGTNLREADRVVFLGTSGPAGGFRAINKVRLSATTGAVAIGSNTVNLVIGQPLAIATLKFGGSAIWRDFITGLPGIPKIDPNACLAFIFYTNSTSSHGFMGLMTAIQA